MIKVGDYVQLTQAARARGQSTGLSIRAVDNFIIFPVRRVLGEGINGMAEFPGGYGIFLSDLELMPPKVKCCF